MAMKPLNVFVEIKVITTRRMLLNDWRTRWRQVYQRVLGVDGLRELETHHHYQRDRGAGTIDYELRRIDERKT
jgi:hypothetical protein